MNATLDGGDVLATQLQDAISTNPYLIQHNLRLEAAGGRVTLHGRVGTYFQKQMAQETLRQFDGVEQIDNLLEVGS